MFFLPVSVFVIEVPCESLDKLRDLRNVNTRRTCAIK